MDIDPWMGKALELEGQVELLRKQIELLSESNFDKVKRFHAVFNKEPDPEIPTRLTEDAAVLRVRLISEEYQEVLRELGFAAEIEITALPSFVYPDDIDLSKLGKELADLNYVVYGTGAAAGLPMDAIYQETHASNMSKIGPNGLPIYRDDGKVLKGPNYRDPDIDTIIEGASV